MAFIPLDFSAGDDQMTSGHFYPRVAQHPALYCLEDILPLHALTVSVSKVEESLGILSTSSDFSGWNQRPRVAKPLIYLDT